MSCIIFGEFKLSYFGIGTGVALLAYRLTYRQANDKTKQTTEPIGAVSVKVSCEVQQSWSEIGS